MSFNPDHLVTLKLDCAGWYQPYAVDITRMQLGEILLKLDDMAAGTDEQATPDTEQKWPTPDEAYAAAPSIDEELDWLNRTANASYDEDLNRDWYLRNAAALDRIALGESTTERACPEEADATAVLLLDLDQASRDYDPRAYVRQQYARWAEQERAATKTRRVTCYVAVCDLCGGTSDYEGSTPHFDTAQDAVDYATASDDGWTRTADGLLVCDAVRDTAHEDAHAAAGKRMSPCAMHVTWDDTDTVLPV
ncbi:hypothetical protein AB0C95_04585 [Streptomyces caniferus]|uniref:hypothetical protein n=1 Tax=Streptomyces caniferus TaxID=285557 RepID=UPI0033C7F3D7